MLNFCKLIPFVLFTLWMGCATPNHNQVTQVATLGGLSAGVYDGEISLDKLASYGDFGIGTYHALDGEMVFLDNIFYQIKGDGSVRRPPPETLTPFATVVKFKPDFFFNLSDVDLEALKRKLDELIPDQNKFVAIRIKGSFTSVQTRSIKAQSKPYPTLDKVIQTQAVFELQNVRGSLVGFRSPAYVRNLNLPGYHFHFINETRTAGGHVLDLTLKSARLSADTIHDKYFIFIAQDNLKFNSSEKTLK